MKTRLFHLHALSALHVGTGQGVGAVDLPIARSRATNLPIVAGSAIKGILRDVAETDLKMLEKNLDYQPQLFNFKQNGRKDFNALFGSPPANEKNDNGDNKDNSKNAGAVAFGDAHLLLLPVRSFAGTVAYATCPFILKRYKRDTRETLDIPKFEDTNDKTQQEFAFVACSNSILKLDKDKNEIALEDLNMTAIHNNNTLNWAEYIAKAVYPNDEDWQQELITRFVILPDDIFSFLADTATEIRTRIKIDRDTRIVKEGALWTEENLPCETVLWGVMGIEHSRDKNNRKTAEELNDLIEAQEQELDIQIGGKHTVGRGLCRLVINKKGK